MSEIVAIDIGGTHARFAIAAVEGMRVTRLDEAVVMRTVDHDGLRSAWEAFGAAIGRPLPRAAGIAVAGPVRGELLKLTNNPWAIRPAEIPSILGSARFVLVNDFAAVAFAVGQLRDEDFRAICGPDRALPAEGAISVIGPGTGLGVALLLRRGGTDHVVETEGGHVDFAPVDPLDDRILGRLRDRYGRVSAERIASGPGLANLYEALAAIEGGEIRHRDDESLWSAALAGEDKLAATAFDRFRLSLGSIAGDIALAHGADALVVAGGLGRRIADRLPGSGFEARFVAKGRFEPRMREIPVVSIAHAQPGLLGAAAAFAARFGEFENRQ
jgi:glucokinase